MPLHREEEPLWAEAVRSLAVRVIGPVAASIRFAELEGERRSFRFVAKGGSLTVSASDSISACVGLHAYLRTAAVTSVGWDTMLPLNLPSLPDSLEVREEARLADAYYLNFCTFSYTTPYWRWSDWEREIDWMALHGITMPLMVVGHEAVLQKAYVSLGVDSESVREFLGGPGYLPFQFMGCLDGFGGDLSQLWIDQHAELGSRILSRQRELGMTPVLPAFSGHVPEGLAPARVTQRFWQGFKTSFLDPTDPLYRKIGAEIARVQISLFGTDHLYAADPFIEMLPIDTDLAYPGVVAESILAGLQDADPRAVWVMQSWPFAYLREFWTHERVTAFLDAIPDDRLLILDLWAESEPQWRRFTSFGRKQWVWCALLNFGGRTDLVGYPDGIVTQLEDAILPDNPPIGIGMTMEGTRNNPVLYELVTDLAWKPVTDINVWLDAFVDQRYRVVHPNLRQGWRELLATVYGDKNVNIFPELFRGIMTEKPSYSPISDLTTLRRKLGSALWYDHARLVHGWELLLISAESDRTLAQGSLGHDLAEVGLSVMLRVADRFYLDVIESSLIRKEGSLPQITKFLRLFEDLDLMLATRSEFSLEAWESSAAGWAAAPEQQGPLVDNARRILTVWGEPATPILDDYAGRIWSGLVGGYYRERWRIWAAGLTDMLRHPSDACEQKLDALLETQARDFLMNGVGRTSVSESDVVTQSRLLFDRYAHEKVMARNAASSYSEQGTE